MLFVAGCVIEGATCRRGGHVPIDERERRNAWGGLKCRGRTRTSGGQTGDVDAAEVMNEVDRCLRNYHIEDVNRRGGRGPRQ